MTDEELIQFAKEEIISGKGFAEVETELLLKHDKSIGEANRLVSLAKESLGFDPYADEEDVKLAKNYALGSKFNALSWLLLIVAIITFFIGDSPHVWGERFFLAAFVLSGISIFLRERIKISFFNVSGLFAKIVGVVIFLSAISGLLSTF